MDTNTTTIVKSETDDIIIMTASQPSLLQIDSTAQLEHAKKKIKVEAEVIVGTSSHLPRQKLTTSAATVDSSTTCNKVTSSMNTASNQKQVSTERSPDLHESRISETAASHVDTAKDDAKKSTSLSMSATVSPKRECESIQICETAVAAPIANDSLPAAGTRLVSTTQNGSQTVHNTHVETKFSTSGSHTPNTACALSNVETSVVLENVTFHSLRRKYLGELEYMLVEFQKLEKQLLGAKVQSTDESVGSKERREKLHSFIVHLEETMHQIVSGCEVESKHHQTPNSEGKDKLDVASAPKLEDHILANLLPVKVRLKRQLAAQQGAKHNPAGMPTVRGGMQQLQPTHLQGKATFLRHECQVERRSSVYGNSVTESCSSGAHVHSLVAKDEGKHVSQSVGMEHLGPQNSTTAQSDVSGYQEVVCRKSNDLVSSQCLSSNGSSQLPVVSRANPSSYSMSLTSPGVVNRPKDMQIPGISPLTTVKTPTGNESHTSEVSDHLDQVPMPSNQQKRVTSHLLHHLVVQPQSAVAVPQTPALFSTPQIVPIAARDANTRPVSGLPATIPPAVVTQFPEEERRRLKRRRKKKKKQEVQLKNHVVCQLGDATAKRNKRTLSQRGPRNVEYTCALCNEIYNSTCDYNPWWALTQHDCPKCSKLQIPKIDISAPANAIEYHPALLAHVDDNGSSANASTPVAVTVSTPNIDGPESDTESDLSDDDDILSGADVSVDASDSGTDDMASMSVGEQAENEKFGAEYTGPQLCEYDASRLIALILHASTCPGQHKIESHDNVCRSAKWMMLHTRDCPGTTSTGDICPFPWCRKMKHLLYHLVSCELPRKCSICKPTLLNRNIKGLMAVSEHRLQRRRILLRERFAQEYPVACDLPASQTMPVSGTQRGQAQIPTTYNYENSDVVNKTSMPSDLIDHKKTTEVTTRQSNNQCFTTMTNSLLVSTDARKRPFENGTESILNKTDENFSRKEVSSAEVLSQDAVTDLHFSRKKGNVSTIVKNEFPNNLINTRAQNANDDLAGSVKERATEEITAIRSIIPSDSKTIVVNSPDSITENAKNQDLASDRKTSLNDVDPTHITSTFSMLLHNDSNPNVFATRANIANGAAFASSDSLQSALAPFLIDNNDVADFPLEEIPCRMDSLTAIASEFEEPILPCSITDVTAIDKVTLKLSATEQILKSDEASTPNGMDFIVATKITESTDIICDNTVMQSDLIALPLCKLEENDNEERRIIVSRHVREMRRDCSNSNLSISDKTPFAISTNNVAVMFTKEPSEIREGRLSSENLVLRVQ